MTEENKDKLIDATEFMNEIEKRAKTRSLKLNSTEPLDPVFEAQLRKDIDFTKADHLWKYSEEGHKVQARLSDCAEELLDEIDRLRWLLRDVKIMNAELYDAIQDHKELTQRGNPGRANKELWELLDNA